MKKNLFRVFSFFLFYLMAFFSCRKNDSSLNITENVLTIDAENWFQNTIVKEETKLLAKSYSVLPQTDSKRVLARMGRLAKKLDWANAQLFTMTPVDFVVVPLINDNIKLREGYKLKRVFLFYRDSKNDMQLEVVELLNITASESQYVEKIGKIISNRLNPNHHSNIETNDAKIFFYNQKYNPILSYQIRNNKWENLSGKSINKINFTKSIPATATTDGGNPGCVLWGTYIIEYDAYGNVISETLINTYWVCGGNGSDTGDSSTDPEGGTPGGGGDEEDDCPEGDEACMFDLAAEAALVSEMTSTTSLPEVKNINVTSSTLADMPFQWAVVKNTFHGWKVTSSDIAEAYESTNTGAIIYRIRRQGSSMPLFELPRVLRRPSYTFFALLKITWAETSYSTSIASDYRSGTVTVSGTLTTTKYAFINVTIPETHTNSCTINVH